MGERVVTIAEDRSVTMPYPRSLVLLAMTVACGCSSGAGSCPTLPPAMASLAAQAASIALAVYDSTASCDGNDVAAGAPAPVSERQVGAGDDATLELPAGRYVIVLHAFEGKAPFERPTLERIAQLKKIYGLDLDARHSHRLKERSGP